MKKIVANITYKSILARFKNIDKRNVAFNNLDPQSKRLEIAWDALQMVLLGLIQPSDGCYWSDALLEISGDSKTLQRKLIEGLPKPLACEVCQRGAIMLSQIRLGNSIGSNDDDRDCGAGYNVKGFNYPNLVEMENEYEHSQYDHPYEYNTREKMANILCNILVNGEFNTEDRTDYLILQ